MTQNIYDDPDFLAAYEQLPRSRLGLDAAPEWPALRSLLPDLSQTAVVDLGCGFGWFCRWASGAGAASVLGVDVSERMLERAASFGVPEGVDYRQADLARVELPHAQFDLVFSSLTLHYLDDLAPVVATVAGALVVSGRFVFSVEHPIFTAPSQPAFHEIDGTTTWPVDGYLREGRRTTDWLAPGVVKHHRMVGTYVNTLVDAGLVVDHVEEWAPSPEQITRHPEWSNERERPPFLLVASHRPPPPRD